MSKIRHHSDKQTMKQPMLTPKEKKRAKQAKKRREHSEAPPPLIEHEQH